jgi:hypothetical protein
MQFRSRRAISEKPASLPWKKKTSLPSIEKNMPAVQEGDSLSSSSSDNSLFTTPKREERYPVRRGALHEAWMAKK